MNEKSEAKPENERDGRRAYEAPAAQEITEIEAFAVNCAGSPGNKSSPGAMDITGGVCQTINT